MKIRAQREARGSVIFKLWLAAGHFLFPLKESIAGKRLLLWLKQGDMEVICRLPFGFPWIPVQAIQKNQGLWRMQFKSIV